MRLIRALMIVLLCMFWDGQDGLSESVSAEKESQISSKSVDSLQRIYPNIYILMRNLHLQKWINIAESLLAHGRGKWGPLILIWSGLTNDTGSPKMTQNTS